MGRLIYISVISAFLISSNFEYVLAKSIVSRSFYVMGTELIFTLVCKEVNHCHQVIQKANNEVLRLDKIFSNYRTDSELYDVVSSNHKNPVKISEDFFRLTAVSVFINVLTNGAFDITSGSLVNLWKNSSKKDELPVHSVITAIKTECVGLKQVMLITASMSLKINSDCTELDFGAIGKGYVLDKISKILQDHKIQDGIINFGGNISALGKNPNGKKWQISLKVPPSLRHKTKLNDIYISNKYVSTSGGYERYYEINKKKYSHIIDPRTGYPVDISKSVTVISSNATIADALSTAFSVMDMDDVRRLVSIMDNIGVLIISDNLKYENDSYKMLYLK